MEKISKKDIQKVNTAMLGLANFMEKSSRSIKRTAIKVDTAEFSSGMIRDFLKGKGFNTLYMADSTYHLTDWETWKRIIKWDWTNKRKYLKDIYDCDDFADEFSAMATSTYGLNSVALAKMTRLDQPNTDKLIGYHRHNLILANDKENGLEAYLYEPMTDGFKKMERNHSIIMSGWEYNLYMVEL